MPKPNNAIPIFHGRVWPVGLTNAAKRLGCSTPHLYQVLKGTRRSERLTAGYAALIAELKGAA